MFVVQYHRVKMESSAPVCQNWRLRSKDNATPIMYNKPLIVLYLPAINIAALFVWSAETVTEAPATRLTLYQQWKPHQSKVPFFLDIIIEGNNTYVYIDPGRGWLNVWGPAHPSLAPAPPPSPHNGPAPSRPCKIRHPFPEILRKQKMNPTQKSNT